MRPVPFDCGGGGASDEKNPAASTCGVYISPMTKKLKAQHTGPARQRKERAIRVFFFLTALASIATLSFIMLFLFAEGVPLFRDVPVSDFLFGRYWYPTSDPPDFGIFPLILASLSVTLVASVISIPLGVMTALYLAESASHRLRQWVKPIVELLAALPSVVIGFFGMVIVAPFLQNTFNLPTGLNLFNASLMLAFMSVPTICSISEDAIFSVPRELKEASLALGATRWETIARVIIPASLSGISTAVILGMSRAIGETMVVLMVAGGAAMIPTSLFDPVRPMPASIAAEMAEAPFRGDHYYALFATGVVLFLFTLLFNLIADHVAHRYKQTGAATL
ncbi:Phosphate ABC transporter, permease protein PstC [uncultured Desulfatiglans sp.]|uniref:Phosphate transport system permease protein n=1 Tax=Uncultured Desulfatiglans sp. TaxID=1748965 RepID=A0A653A4C0_UNCDX|nr:Phosphate ABC transporter, permease protein PstC [uncultured Desulfatiglans sp.]